YLTRKRRAISFKEWYEPQPAMREPWILDGIKEYRGRISKKAKEVSLEEYGRPPVNFLKVRARDYSDYSKWDWILTFNLKTANDLEWFCISNLVKVPSKDKGYDREYPCEMIQDAPLRVYEVPPFTLDRPFRTAFKKAANTYGLDRLEEH